jgi:SSS family solute:Na+ symporter
MFWKRTTTQGAQAGLIGGIILQVIVILLDVKFAWNLHWLYLAAIAEGLTFILILAVSLGTAPSPYEQWEPFLWRPSMGWAASGSDGRPWFASVALWYCILVAIWIYLYWLLW